MNAFLIVSNFVAWIIAAICLIGFLLVRRVTKIWADNYKKTKAELESIEHRNNVTDSERAMFEWYREENQRLERKCRAICMGVRKLKGRGKWTCEGHPTHRF